MCGRFNVINDPLNRLIVELTGHQMDLETRYNIAPTEPVQVLRIRDEAWSLTDMRWWLVPYWSDGPSNRYAMYNAKMETITKSRAFREPFQRRRCVVPASGWYEWVKEGNQRLPFYLAPVDEPGLAFAALWDRWRGEGQVIESCTIVTTAAPDAMKPWHNRMPVHLTPDQVRQWINADTDAETLKNLLAPGLRMPIEVTPVSTWTNNARNKDDRIIEPIGESTIIH